MSDDLNKKIKQITDILGQEKLPDHLQNLLSILANSAQNEDPSPGRPEGAVPNEGFSENVDMGEPSEKNRKPKKTPEKFISNQDPRVSLLLAIKPFLSNYRQKKVGDCLKILQLSRIANLLDENEP